MPSERPELTCPGWSAALLTVLTMLIATGAQAQVAAEDDTIQGEALRASAARELFLEGLGSLETEEYERAADRFRRALSLRESDVIRTNLGLALARTGDLVEAAEHLRRVQRNTAVGSDPHTLASQALADIEPQLGSLQVEVEGDSGGVRVTLDGRALPPALYGVPHLADPGAHRVRLYQHDQLTQSTEVEVRRMETAVARLQVVDLGEDAAPIDITGTGLDGRGGPTSLEPLWITFIAVGGVGLATLVAGAATGAHTIASTSSFEQRSCELGMTACDPGYEAELSGLYDLASLTDALLVVGGAMVGVAAIALPVLAAEATVELQPTAGGAVARVTGEW